MPATPIWPDSDAVAAVGTQTVELDWTMPATALPDTLPVGTIVGYKIQRSTDSGTTWVDVVADTRNKKTYYSDTHSSLAGKSVIYRVAAINSIGMGVYSANSTPSTLPVANKQPGAPTGLNVVSGTDSASETDVTLTWNAPSSRGTSAIDEYKVCLLYTSPSPRDS